MQLLRPQSSALVQSKTNISLPIAFRCFFVTMICVAMAVSAALAPGLMPSKDAALELQAIPAAAQVPAEAKLSNPATGLDAQISLNNRATNINPEAFNFMREKKIAVDTQKLLQLAIALKAEIDSNSGGAPSLEALAKAKEIERLAKDVKSWMSSNPVLERP
jgi:hypothetical protein